MNLRGGTTWPGLEPTQDLGLARCAYRRCSGLQGARRAQHPAGLSGKCRRFRLAQPQWQRRHDHLADRVVVVACGPGQEIEIGLSQQRLVVQHGLDRLDA